MKFLEQIQAKLKEKGLSPNLFVLVDVESESEIEGKVNELKDRFDNKDEKPKLMKEISEKIGVSDLFNDSLQREGDRRVSDAQKKFEEKYKKDTDNSNSNESDKAEKAKETKDLTPEQKELLELKNTVKSLSEKLEQTVNSTQTNQKKEQVKQLLKKKGLREDFVEYINFNDEDKPIESQIEKLETTIKGIQKETIENAVEDGYQFKKGGANVSTSAIEKFAEKKKESNQKSN